MSTFRLDDEYPESGASPLTSSPDPGHSASDIGGAFRKKPVVVLAMQWKGGDYKCLEDFCGRNWNRADAVDEAGPADAENVVVWNTAESQWLNVPVGHWIVRGIHGELYPCKPDIFAATYEPVSAPEARDEGQPPTVGNADHSDGQPDSRTESETSVQHKED